jgi:chromosome segregation ATPase
MIPPPIIQSTYTTPPPSASIIGKSTVFEHPIASDTREDELHADLQFLLDAQVEALAQGLESGKAGDGASTGSTTPTLNSVRTGLSRPGSRPAKKRLGLRSARKGLYTTITALSGIKREELQSLDAEVEEAERKLQQIDTWGTKRKGLEDASSGVDEGEDTVRVQRLRQEADVLQDSIQEVEVQLADMKAKHRKLVRQIAAAENSTQAKLASYTQSISLLEADVQKFLSLQPSVPQPRLEASNGQLSIWQLPPKRRTLEMAKAYFAEERDSTIERRRQVEQEKEALELGGKMWMDVAVSVTEFEKRVRAEMSGADMANSGHAWDDQPQSSPGERLKELLVQMDTVMGDLESKLHTAEEKNWKLLIAAIGAELDALRQGRTILKGVLGEPEPELEPQLGDVHSESAIVGEMDSGDEIRGLDKSFETARRRMSNGDTDDEPDPELLFSTHDTDTE